MVASKWITKHSALHIFSQMNAKVPIWLKPLLSYFMLSIWLWIPSSSLRQIQFQKNTSVEQYIPIQQHIFEIWALECSFYRKKANVWVSNSKRHGKTTISFWKFRKQSPGHTEISELWSMECFFFVLSRKLQCDRIESRQATYHSCICFRHGKTVLLLPELYTCLSSQTSKLQRFVRRNSGVPKCHISICLVCCVMSGQRCHEKSLQQQQVLNMTRRIRLTNCGNALESHWRYLKLALKP